MTYFKWDAIGQYGCDDPGHQHGTAENTPAERADRYAFQLGGAMAGVVDKLSDGNVNLFFRPARRGVGYAASRFPTTNGYRACCF